MQPKHHNSYKKTLHKQTDACVLTDKCLLFYTGAPQCRSLVTKLSFCSFNFFTLGCLIRVLLHTGTNTDQGTEQTVIGRQNWCPPAWTFGLATTVLVPKDLRLTIQTAAKPLSPLNQETKCVSQSLVLLLRKTQLQLPLWMEKSSKAVPFEHSRQGGTLAKRVSFYSHRQVRDVFFLWKRVWLCSTDCS